MARIKLFENVFDELKRLFNTDIIVRRLSSGQLKVVDIDNIQSMGVTATNYLSNRLSGLYATSLNSSRMGYAQSISMFAQRLMLFRDYELMEQDPIISSALSLYSEEATIKNEFDDILRIDCDDENTKNILENLYYNILNLEFNLPHWIRNLVKYGDWFMKLNIAEKYGIVSVIPISVYYVSRIEGEDPDHPNRYRFKVDVPGIKGKFENYEISHMRLLTDSNYLPYGKSMIEGARRNWKQLTLMEDAMLIHRIMRAPQKRIFKIDVGNLPPEQIDGFMQKIINTVKKIPYVDSTTGDYNLKYNMQNIIEDFYLPVRGGDSGTSIDTLSGLEYNPIDDIEYLRNKMLAALRIPKAFLNYEEDLNAKATLSAEDIRFARTIERIQRTVEAELTRLGILHLYAQNIRDEKLINFSIRLTHPSIVYEQEKIELWKSKMDLASAVLDSTTNNPTLSSDWVYKFIYNMSDDEKDEERKKVVEDVKRRLRLQQIELSGNDPVKTGKIKNPVDSATGTDSKSGTGISSKFGTDDHFLGRDPSGNKANKGKSLDKTSGTEFKGNSPLALNKETLETLKTFSKDKNIIKTLKVLGENIVLYSGSIEDMTQK